MDIRDIEHPSPKQAGIVETIESVAEIEPDLQMLRAYTRTKLALADQLRILREALTALGREHSERQCGELVVKLAEDRFTLAVLGQFKRGKSSLMNGIIGRELLPTGVIPLTSAITVLKYGPAERLVVHREDSIFPDELPVASLADYVTEKGNPANCKKVKTAYVELPVPFLRRGIEFMDTPGVGSAVTANTATTYGFLPECDAVLFVTSVDMPLTSLELAFLKEIQQYVDRIFFVVNKIDLLADDERDEVLRFVAKTIQTQMGCKAVKIFPVSARIGIAAKLSCDPVLYEQSGLKMLEEALASFLSKEKSAAFLAAVAHKALQVLGEEAAQNAFEELALQARGKAMEKEKSAMGLHDLQAAVSFVAAAQAKLQTLYESILAGRAAKVTETENLATSEAKNRSAAATMVSPIPEVADLRTRGCPVCQYIAGFVRFTPGSCWEYLLHTELLLGMRGWPNRLPVA